LLPCHAASCVTGPVPLSPQEEAQLGKLAQLDTRKAARARGAAPRVPPKGLNAIKENEPMIINCSGAAS